MAGWIKVGDIVSINFHNVKLTLIARGVVVSVPLAPGEAWVITGAGTKDCLFYISEPCTIELLKKR